MSMTTWTQTFFLPAARTFVSTTKKPLVYKQAATSITNSYESSSKHTL